MPFRREPANALFVAAEGETFVQAGIELALEFAYGPVLTAGFYLIETALVRILDAEEEEVMSPAQVRVKGRIDGEDSDSPVIDWKTANWSVND